MLYTIFDTETSGLESGCDVLSFAYMLTDENLDIKRAETLYYWKEGVTKWTEEAYQIHGLSKEFLRQYEADYETNLKKMYLVLSYSELVGYNSGRLNKEGLVVGFDFAVCKNFLMRNDLYEPTPLNFYDTMIMYRRIYKHQTSLQKAFDEQGLPRDLADTFMEVYYKSKAGAHDAAYDTVCTALLFNKMYVDGHLNLDSKPPIDLLHEVDTLELEDYKIYFDELDGICFKNTTDETIMSATDFCKKYPVLFDRILANPLAYM